MNHLPCVIVLPVLDLVREHRKLELRGAIIQSSFVCLHLSFISLLSRGFDRPELEVCHTSYAIFHLLTPRNRILNNEETDQQMSF